MIPKNTKLNNQNSNNSAQHRLQEVAKILTAGIIRLDQRQRSQNHRYSLDHKNFPSTHSDNINSINQVSHIYE